MLHGMLFSEALMFHLGEKIGKQTAHHLIRDAILAANSGDKTFRELLLEDPEIGANLSREELDSVMDYSKHIGKSIEQVDAVIAFSRKAAKTDKDYMCL
jgi:adenylosuccinate lyase